MKPLVATAALCVALFVPSVALGEDPQRTASTVVLVYGGEGIHDLEVHPSLVTAVHVPDPIKDLLSSDPGRKRFLVHKIENGVTIHPRRRAGPDARGSVTIVTETMRITLLLRVAKKARDAEGQVTFKAGDQEEQIKKRIDAAVSKAVEAERAKLDVRVDEQMALRVYRRLESQRMGAIDRNRDRVVTRVSKVVRAGDDSAFVFFEIENLSGRPYHLSTVAVTAGDKDLARAIVWSGQVASAPRIGVVAKNGTGRGLVVVRGLAKLQRHVALTVAEASGRRAVTVQGVRLK